MTITTHADIQTQTHRARIHPLKHRHPVLHAQLLQVIEDSSPRAVAKLFSFIFVPETAMKLPDTALDGFSNMLTKSGTAWSFRPCDICRNPTLKQAPADAPVSFAVCSQRCAKVHPGY